MCDTFRKWPPPISSKVPIGHYFVYQYHHIDYSLFMRSAEEVLSALPNAREIITDVSQLFREAGWEGDGEIEMIWLPPFVGVGIEDTHGAFLFHVKQSNNGTSFIASPERLHFESDSLVEISRRK